MVVVLDRLFVNRSRTLEKKDGNPLNEVRTACDSILEHDGVLAANKTIKFNPGTSMNLESQHWSPNQKLTEADFVRLSRPFCRNRKNARVVAGSHTIKPRTDCLRTAFG